MKKPNIAKFLWDLVRAVGAAIGAGPGPRRREEWPWPGPVTPVEPDTPPIAPPSSTPIVTPSPSRFGVAMPDDMRTLVLSGRAGQPAPHQGRAFVERVVREANDPRWGLHQRPNGVISTDILAWNVTPYRIFDVIVDEEGARDATAPTWQGGIEIEPGSRFLPILHRVPARINLPRLRVDGRRFVRPDGTPFVWAGATSFDFPVRVADGDERWADWLAAEGFTVARIITASVYRRPRTMDEGLWLLPPALEALAARGLYAEVVVLCDSAQMGLTPRLMRDYVAEVAAICADHPHTVLEAANENTHGGQHRELADPVLLAEFRARVPDVVPFSAGSTHGGEAPRWTQGTYMTHHPDRSLSPERNAEIMAQAPLAIVDDESIGIAATARAGSRVNDPDYGARQARAARQHGLAGVTLHLEAGIDARVDQLDDVQREAARRFIAAWGES